MNALDEINAIADASPGFVWRFQTADGNATAERPFDDDAILVNFSTWTSIDALADYRVSIGARADSSGGAANGSSEWTRSTACCGGFRPATTRRSTRRSNDSITCDSRPDIAAPSPSVTGSTPDGEVDGRQTLATCARFDDGTRRDQPIPVGSVDLYINIDHGADWFRRQ